jgi:hypothetical protein
MPDEFHPHSCVFEVRQEVPGLLDYPGQGRVLRGARDPDPAGAMLHRGQDAGLRAVEKAGGEEVRRQHRPGPGPQESGAWPGQSRSGAGGRPGRPRRDRRAQRRRTMSRCQRQIVAGVTISRIPARRSVGSVSAGRASHARSGHVSLAAARGRSRRATAS